MMDALLAFYFGWKVGTRSGPAGADELTEAIDRLRASEEFADVVTALRHHAGDLLRVVAEQVEQRDNDRTRTDILASVYELIFPERSAAKES